MNDLEESLKRIRRAEAISHAGTGSNHENTNFLKMRIYSSNLLANLGEMEIFTFQVRAQGYVTKNGNVTHKIELIQPFTRVTWQEPVVLSDKIVIAKSEGSLNKFCFTMQAVQLRQLERTRSLSKRYGQLFAEQQYKNTVRITWLEM